MWCYLHALNYCMVLPGPEAIQLATYLGWLMHGIPGGLIAGGLFLAPSVLVLLCLSTLYAVGAQLPLLAAVFWALKPAVLAIVLQAAWRIGRRTLHHPALVLVAAAAFVALAVLKFPYPLIVAGAALLGWGVGRWQPQWVQKRKAEYPHDQASCQLQRRTALETVVQGPGLPELAAQAAHNCAHLLTDGRTKELHRQVRESRRLDAAVDGKLGITDNADLTDDAFRKHR